MWPISVDVVADARQMALVLAVLLEIVVLGLLAGVDRAVGDGGQAVVGERGGGREQRSGREHAGRQRAQRGAPE